MTTEAEESGEEFGAVLEQIDQWDGRLKETSGDWVSPLRNWLLPVLRRLATTTGEAVAALQDDTEEYVGELAHRIDEVSSLSRAVVASSGMVQVLADSHELARRVLAADLGEITQELAEHLRATCEPHANAMAQAAAAVAAARQEEAPAQTEEIPAAPANGGAAASEPDDPENSPSTKKAKGESSSVEATP